MNGMTIIVKTITRLLIGFIVVYSAGIILYGHITPGGGFAGGVMLAGAFVLLVLACGGETAAKIVGKKTLTVWDSVGALGFLVIGMLGFFGGWFFLNDVNHGTPFSLVSGGTILLSNITIGVKVAAGLFGVFLALVYLKTHES
jgi:multicomponent Na+:H+ antiporter subunit B